MTDLCVIVCTRERPSLAARVVRDVRRQAPAVPLVVVDQSDPAARTALEAAVRGEATVVPSPPRGLPYARNLGLQHVGARVTLFLDDDVVVLPGLIAAHLAAYDEGVGGVGGRIAERVVRPNADDVTNRVAPGGRVRTRLWGTSPAEIATLKGANMSFLTEALRRIGGFDSGYGGTAFLEDADASQRVRRLGYSLRFAPRAEVVHLSAPAGGVRIEPRDAEWWRFHNTGYFMRRHRGPACLPRLVPTFAAIAVRRAREWRDPSVGPRLMAALGKGWRAAGGPPRLEPMVAR